MAGGFANTDIASLLNSFTAADTARYDIAAAQEQRREAFLDRQAQDINAASQMLIQEYEAQREKLDQMLGQNPEFASADEAVKESARKQLFIKDNFYVVRGVMRNMFKNNVYGVKLSKDILGEHRDFEDLAYDPRSDSYGMVVKNGKTGSTGFLDPTPDGVNTKENPDVPHVAMAGDQLFDNLARVGDLARMDRGMQTAGFAQNALDVTDQVSNEANAQRASEARSGLGSASKAFTNNANAASSTVINNGLAFTGSMFRQDAGVPGAPATVSAGAGGQQLPPAGVAPGVITAPAPAFSKNVQLVLSRFEADKDVAKAIKSLRALASSGGEDVAMVEQAIQAVSGKTAAPDTAGGYEIARPESADETRRKQARDYYLRYKSPGVIPFDSGVGMTKPIAEFADSLKAEVEKAGGKLGDRGGVKGFLLGNPLESANNYIKEIRDAGITRSEFAGQIKDPKMRATLLRLYDEQTQGASATTFAESGATAVDRLPEQDKAAAAAFVARLTGGEFGPVNGGIDIEAVLKAMPAGLQRVTRNFSAKDMEKVLSFFVDKSFAANEVKKLTPKQQRMYGALATMGTPEQLKAFTEARTAGSAELSNLAKAGVKSAEQVMTATPVTVDDSIATEKLRLADRAAAEEGANQRAALTARAAADKTKPAEDKWMSHTKTQSEMYFQSGDEQTDQKNRSLFTYGMNKAAKTLETLGIDTSSEKTYATASTIVAEYVAKMSRANPNIDPSTFDASAALYARFPPAIYNPQARAQGRQVFAQKLASRDPTAEGFALKYGVEGGYTKWAQTMAQNELEAVYEANGVK